MTLKSKFTQVIADKFKSDEGAELINNAFGAMFAADACEKVCDEFAISFAEWITTTDIHRTVLGGWKSKSAGLILTTESLLTYYKTEVYGK